MIGRTDGGSTLAAPLPMRVLVVSAHYPPDFVSGGTLVPQREALGLRARGHHVEVFAGHLDPARPPLHLWTDSVSGVPVHWIAIAPFIGWSDTNNYDNPGVTAAIDDVLDRTTPDVVHVHSIQSLGVGVIEAAAERGIPVVLTMHDFWWVCARQFLVDTNDVPCSLVVDAGCCGCEAGRDWLEVRNRRLRAALDRVSLVLAPSASAAAVFVANGLAPDRVVVDENGLDVGVVRTPRAPLPGRPVELVYAGGPNAMKGVRVLAAAARALSARRPGRWRLRAFGVDEANEHWPAEVVTEAPFDPDERTAVLGGADVVVIPSLMRESHSLLAREALLAGAAVVTSDSIGPEEVVVDGGNGLLVPTGDHDALADALARLIDEPATLHALQRADPPAVRTIDDQVDGVEAWLRQVIDGELAPPAADPPAAARRAVPPVPVPERPLPPLRRVLFITGIDGAPLRYRAQLPADGLWRRGVDVEVRYYRAPDLGWLAAAADVIVSYRVPATVQILDLYARVKEERPHVPILGDLDDLIFDPTIAEHIPALQQLPPAEAELWLDGIHRYRTTLEACDGFIGSTEALCARAHDVTGLPTWRFANGVGRVLGERAEAALRRPRRPGPLRVGYLSGTTTHDGDWAAVEAEVVETLLARPGSELWLVGHLVPTPAIDALGERVRRVPFRPWYELPEILRDLDVNLSPLEPGMLFNESKSAIKWLEAGLCATPTIASPTGPFREALGQPEPGSTGVPGRDGVVESPFGILADPAVPGAWARALGSLLDDASRRRTMGERARRRVLLEWSPWRQADRYAGILDDARTLVAAGRPERSSTWELRVADEPPEVVALSPYAALGGTAADPGTGAAPVTARARALGRRALIVVREEGAVAAARRVPGAVAVRARSRPIARVRRTVARGLRSLGRRVDPDER